MDTSKSTRQYFAGVSIFSGRPDPTWSVSEEIASRLLKLFDTAASHDGPPPAAPPLGYRGVFLRDDAGHEWYAYRGVVMAKGADTRVDRDRAFERTLIDSAPEGLLPAALLHQEFQK